LFYLETQGLNNGYIFEIKLFCTSGTKGVRVDHCSTNILCLWHFYFSGLAMPQRGSIFIEKEIGVRNRPFEILFQGKSLLSDGISKVLTIPTILVPLKFLKRLYCAYFDFSPIPLSQIMNSSALIYLVFTACDGAETSKYWTSPGFREKANDAIPCLTSCRI